MSITQAVTPLRMIFWGGLLCLFDISNSWTTSVNGQSPTGFQFDVLNDFLGMLLITVGIAKLSAFAIDQSFRFRMRFVFICAVLNCVEAFFGHFIFESPMIFDVLSNILGLASLCAIVIFCTSMHRLSSAFALTRSAKSWLTTRLLVIILWVVPLGLFYVVVLGALLTGQSFQLYMGILFIMTLSAVVPFIHLFISTSRMRHEAEFPKDLNTG